MPKKTTILILILALVTGVLVFLAVSSENKKQETPNNPTTTEKKVVQKTAKVFFSPQNLDLSANSATATPTVDLMVDTGDTDIVGVQAEMQFDPKALTGLRIDPAVDAQSFFGPSAVVLFNDINIETGRVSYAIAISPDQQPKKGVGKIGTLTFQKAFGAPNITSITFLNKTLVTVLGQNESVLKETMPLTITLSQVQATQAPFIPITTTAPVAQ